MKRVFPLLLAAALAATLAGSALGVGGTADDPAVSLSYLEDVFGPALEADWQQAVHDGLGSTYRTALLDATEHAASLRRTAEKNAAATPQKAEGVMILKQGDVLTGLPGCRVTVKNGSITADTSYLIDVTNGKAVTKGAALSRNILYMMGDTDTGELKVTSATCELTVNGVYKLSPADSVDYGSMARALDAMGLFEGTGTGYVLENTASRAQGLVMFLRILGLEDEALSYTGSCPFTDVPSSHWAYRYVAYAYANGLTTGTSADKFSPDRAITCQHYATFLLRALHYDENSDFSYNTAVADLSKLGLFNQKETAALSAGNFVRYKMVYLSYYALFGVDQTSGGLLMNRLLDDGAVDRDGLTAGLYTVSGTRIS